MPQADVLILGAGPAGATAALNLAATHRVLMVDRAGAPAPHIGESLPPAAARLMRDMDLLDDFLLQGHAPYHGNLAMWNGACTEYHFLRDPDGHGWHLARGKFDAWLREKARQRGAALLTPASVEGIDADGDGWRVQLAGAGGGCVVRAKIVIDASGRGAVLARKLGARRTRRDQLAGYWLYGRDQQEQAGGGFSHIEGSEHGWWYSAPLPDRRRVLAYHTDADLAPAPDRRDAERLLAAALQLPGMGGVLAHAGFAAETEVRAAAAHSAALDAAAGPGWFAVGDAALSFDPLSSQGIFNAMYTGLAAAEAIARALDGDAQAHTEYTAELAAIRTAYERHLAFSYAQEQRWPTSPFWRRRHSPAA